MTFLFPTKWRLKPSSLPEPVVASAPHWDPSLRILACFIRLYKFLLSLGL